MLADVVARLAERRTGRTEANVQSDLHVPLTIAPFDLDDTQLQDILKNDDAVGRKQEPWVRPGV